MMFKDNRVGAFLFAILITALTVFIGYLMYQNEQLKVSLENQNHLNNELILQNRGPRGDDGKSAFEIAQENGFAGTVQEWLESLRGEPGTPGIDGSPAVDGKTGTTGKSIGSVVCDTTGNYWLVLLTDGSRVGKIRAACIP